MKKHARHLTILSLAVLVIFGALPLLSYLGTLLIAVLLQKGNWAEAVILGTSPALPYAFSGFMALGLVGIIWGTKLLDDEAELEKPADVIPFRGERR